MNFIPKIIHPRKVLLFKRIETLTDPEFGVLGENIFAEPIELRGQVKYNNFQTLTPVSSGNDPVSDGHIVFYNDEWVKSGGKVNDELELEEDYTFTSRLKIIEVRPAAHYNAKNYHVHVYFERIRTVSK